MPTLKVWDSTASEWIRVCGTIITAPQLEFLSHVSVDPDTGLPLWDSGPWPGSGSAPSAAAAMLLEDGSYLLLEDGSLLLFE
jgi:hypothetical protein